MKIRTWLPAAGLLMFGGMAAAQEDEVREQELKEEARELREEAQESTEETGKKAARRVEEAGEKAGSAVGQGIREGSRALAGYESSQERGILREGDRVRNTLTTNPVGLFLGEGLNATYARSMNEKLSVVGGARFSRTRFGDGSLNAFGILGGIDYFLLGQHNEGLRVGPRLEASFGRETIGDESSGSAGVGAAGELGYNWVATNGITAGAGAGLRFELGGDLDATDGPDVDAGWGPYGRLNLGYSW